MSDPGGSIDHMPELTDTDRDMLAFERTWWKYAGAKETAIREQFDMTAVAYYARLNWLIDQDTAMAADPMTVRRLLRLRAARAGAREGVGSTRAE